MADFDQKEQSRAGLLAQRLIPRPDWPEYFMAIAKVISTRSTCSSRPVGCVIVQDNRILVSGYNGPPSGAAHCTDRNSGGDIYCARRAHGISDALKLEICQSVHAEENALLLAEKLGIRDTLAGAAVYTTLAPCIRCIGRLKEAGIRNVYYEHPYQSIDRRRDAEWEETARASFENYERIHISGPSSFKMAAALVGVTSDRLLPSE